jgi:hypothetical protein
VRLNEQKLYDLTKKHLGNTSSLWLQRVENLTASGMPDLVITNSLGRTSWVELKFAVPPKRDVTPLLGRGGLNTAQIAWHLKAAALNLPTYVLVRAGKEILLVTGRAAASINHWPLADLRAAAVATSWEAIDELLRK